MPDSGVLVGVDLHSATNNEYHRTNKISHDQLIVRRGQSFHLTLQLRQPFNPNSHSFTFTTVTGEHPSEERGTKSLFGFPNTVWRLAAAKAIWRAELHGNSDPKSVHLHVLITPPADAPIGRYTLSVQHKGEKNVQKEVVVLFNPWCSDDWVYISDEAQKQEYVLNERGIVYTGTAEYIQPMYWDLGQFSEGMVNICLKILDKNIKHLRDAADDVSARCNPIYVSRVVSAMINSHDDYGVLSGKWDPPYNDGVPPMSWNGSYVILKKWMDTNCRPVKYGQCWVFACVMCSVMRLLGIPCRVVTNFESAHDKGDDLSVDVYHVDKGVTGKKCSDDIWNFHVWVEGWMKRPDLTTDGKYDGWQALDPTPQEKSIEMVCCGPAPVSAILNGDVHLKYDIPFVFAEVNADRNVWLEMADGSKQFLSSDIVSVGQNISTKAVGQNSRQDITNTYKHKEGSKEERLVYKYARQRLGDTSGERILINRRARLGTVANNELVMRFEEVSEPVKGAEVNFNFVVSNKSKVLKKLSISNRIQALKHNGRADVTLQTYDTVDEVMPGKDLIIPVVVPFSEYSKHMEWCEVIAVTALVKDLMIKPHKNYLAEKRIVLKDPLISITVPDEIKVNQDANVELFFVNPVQEVLKNCTLKISGSGLIKGEEVCKLPDLKSGKKITRICITPHQSGERLLLFNFDSSRFKNVKLSRIIDVLA